MAAAAGLAVLATLLIGFCRPAAAAKAITVRSASYGANCNRANLNNVTGHIGARCNGRSSCEYLVDHNTIGDPSPFCQKDYAVTFTCGGGQPRQVQVAPEASGKIASLSCADAAQNVPGEAAAPQQPGRKTGQIWGAVATVWNLNGDVAVGAAYNYPEEADARRSALAECSKGATEKGFSEQMVAGCEVVRVFTKGCFFYTIGQDPETEKYWWFAGTTAKQALGKCRSGGYTDCSHPSGGCIGR